LVQTDAVIPDISVTSDDTERPSRRPIAVVAGLFVVVVAALVMSIAAAHVRPSGHSRAARGGTAAPPPGLTLTLPRQPAVKRDHFKPNAATSVISLLLFAAGVVIICGVLFAVLRAVYNLLLALRLALRRRRRTTVVATDVAPADLARQMSDAVDEALGELEADRPVSDSIIECWQRLQSAAAEAGVAPVRSDTPDEAIRRIFFATEVSGTPLRTLAELYREARFSRHRMGPDDLVSARAALTAIMVDLRDEAEEPHDVHA
jgi:hypothetical protein